MATFFAERVDGRVGKILEEGCVLLEIVLCQLERLVDNLLGVHQVTQFWAENGDDRTDFNVVAFQGYVPSDISELFRVES